MRITPSSGLSASEIYDLIEEAGRNADTDRKTKEMIIARNRLEGLLQNSVRSFSEFGWMLSADNQEYVRRTLEAARTAAVSDDGGEIRTALEELERAARMMTDAMFRPTQVSPAAGSSDDADSVQVPEVS